MEERKSVVRLKIEKVMDEPGRVFWFLSDVTDIKPDVRDRTRLYPE